MMKKWLKLALVLVATGLVVLLVATATSYYLVTGTPDWYHPGAVSETERLEAANRAIQKYASLQTWAADAQAEEARRDHGNTSTRYAPVDNELTIRFSQQELNGFLYSWSEQFDWDQWYGKYIKDPMIVLQEDRLVLAGKLRDYDAVVSFQFDPSLDNDGNLHLNLERVQGGKLPLPQSVWSGQRAKFESALKRRLPAWRKAARINGSGEANDAAVYSGLAELALGAMSEQGAEPVLFLWVTNDFTGGQREFRKIPVKLTAVKIDDEALQLTVRRLDRAQREAYLRHLHDPKEPVTLTQR